MRKLSIIMPCYNCQETLKEAFDSTYTQGLTNFEIIMVDDGSKDGTADLMKKLAQGRAEVRLFFHEKNQGGGAARNTGIKNATGEIIFCLDSDNILAPNSLSALGTFLEKKNCDGVVIHERRFFGGTNHLKYKSHFNKILDRSILLEDIFNGSDTILDNFLFTKASYLKTTGYPTHHGFDTQSYEMRYLGVGNTAFVCPGSVFYHRQNMKQKSYFERVYESGDFSKNYYLAIEDIIHLLSDETVEKILSFEIFEQSNIRAQNLKAFLDSLYKKSPTTFFSSPNRSVKNPSFTPGISSDKKTADIFREAVYFQIKKMYSEALRYQETLLERHIHSTILWYNLLRSAHGLSGVPHEKIESVVQKTVAALAPRTQEQLFSKRSFAKRLLLLPKKVLKKIIT